MDICVFSTMWNLLKSSMRWQQRNSGDPASETPKKSRRFSMTSGDTMGFSKHVSTTKCWWYLDTCSWICWIYYTSTDLYIYVYIYNCVKIITSNYTSWYFDVLVLQCSLGQLHRSWSMENLLRTWLLTCVPHA